MTGRSLGCSPPAQCPAGKRADSEALLFQVLSLGQMLPRYTMILCTAMNLQYQEEPGMMAVSRDLASEDPLPAMAGPQT